MIKLNHKRLQLSCDYSLGRDICVIDEEQIAHQLHSYMNTIAMCSAKYEGDKIIFIITFPNLQHGINTVPFIDELEAIRDNMNGKCWMNTIKLINSKNKQPRIKVVYSVR